MKPARRLLALCSITFVSLTVAALADVVTSNATVRTFNFDPNGNDQGALSLFSNGGDNIQRSWLNFDLTSYSGKALTSDVTMTLQAGIFGNSLNGVRLGTANAGWSAGSINWNNSPSISIVPGVVNPNQIVGPTGPVNWTIPWYIVEKWATLGYNGIGLTSGPGSTQHFYSLADSNPANHPTLSFASDIGADGSWAGAHGDWTGTANWAAGTAAQGLSRVATFSGGTPVTVTLDANRSIGSILFSGANHTIAGGAGKLALSTAAGLPSVDVESGRTATIGAVIVGTDGIEKTGAGTLVLTGQNSYTGTTRVTQGVLSLGSASLNDDEQLNLASGAKVNLAFSGTDVIGSLVLNGVTMPEGTYNASTPVHGSYFTGTGSVSVLPPMNNGTWTSVFAGNWGDTSRWQGGLMAFGKDRIATFGGSTGVSVTLDQPRTIGSLVFNASDYNLVGSNVLTLSSDAGASQIAVNGAYLTVINGPLNNVNGIRKTGIGDLEISGNNTLGTLEVVGGTLAISGGVTTIAGDLKQSADGGNRITISNAQVNVNQLYSSADDLDSVGMSFTLDSDAEVYSPGGTFSRTWRGSGGMILNGGSLRTPWLAANSSTVPWLNNRGRINFNGTTIIATQNEGEFIRVTGGVNYTNENMAMLNATTVFDSAQYNVTIGVALNGAGGLVKKGSGTLTLTSTSNYQGGTEVQAGKLELVGATGGNGVIRGSLTVGAGANVTHSGGDGTGFGNNSGAKLDALTIQSGEVVAGNSSLWGATVNMTGGSLSGQFQWNTSAVTTTASTSTATISGTIQLRPDNGFGSAVFTVENGSAATDLLVSSNITQSAAAVGITKEGAGRMELNGNNSYTGETTVNEGVLSLGVACLGDGSAVSVAAGATLEMAHGTQDTIDKLFLNGEQVGSGIWGGPSSSAPNKSPLLSGSGTLNVVSSPQAADPYLAWIGTYFAGETNPAIVGNLADPDNDGISNVMEYVLKDGNPAASSTAILPEVSASGANFVFTFYRRVAATGTTQTFEFSNSLGAGSWTSIAIPTGEGVVVNPSTPVAGVEQVIVTVPKNGNSRLFGRLKVVK